jgi:hypothetical protein
MLAALAFAGFAIALAAAQILVAPVMSVSADMEFKHVLMEA